MSPSPEEKLYKIRATAWYRPPPETLLNAPVPRTASNIQRSLTPFQRSLYFAIVGGTQKRNLDPRKTQEIGTTVYAPPGYTELARFLQVDRKTIYRNVAALTGEKNMLRTFERFGAKGDRIGTWYAAPHWKDVLAERIANPEIAKAVRGEKLIPLVIGRGRHWMTPADAELWQIKLDQVPESAEVGDDESEFDAADAGDTAATDATVASDAQAAGIDSEASYDLVMAALLDVCGAADEDDRDRVIKLAYKTNRDREIPDQDIAAMVRAIGRQRRKLAPEAPVTPGFVLKLMRSQVHGWRNAQLQRRADEARAERRRAEAEAAYASDPPPEAEAAESPPLAPRCPFCYDRGYIGLGSDRSPCGRCPAGAALRKQA